MPSKRRKAAGDIILQPAAAEMVLSGDAPRLDGLRTFTSFLEEIAQDGASNPQLDEQERDKLRRHGKMLSKAVAELEQLLVDQQPTADAREHYLHTLWQALGSASLIVSYQVENPFLARKARQGSVRGVEGTKARTRDIEGAITTVLWPMLQKYPTRSTGWIVKFTDLVDRVNKELVDRGRKELKPDTIERRVNRLRMNARLSD